MVTPFIVLPNDHPFLPFTPEMRTDQIQAKALVKAFVEASGPYTASTF